MKLKTKIMLYVSAKATAKRAMKLGYWAWIIYAILRLVHHWYPQYEIVTDAIPYTFGAGCVALPVGLIGMFCSICYKHHMGWDNAKGL